MTLIKASIGSLLYRIGRPSMPEKFVFSADAKHNSIVLTEFETRAFGSSTDTSYATAVIEPILPLDSISRISFRINNSRSLFIGVCYMG